MRASMSSASGCVNVSNVRTADPPGFVEGARDLEGTTHGVVAEEHPQHGGVCGVEAVVSRGPLGIRRGEERRPGRVCLGAVVLVVQRRGDRVPRPPEVEVVLVVPAVDRRVRAAEVLQREEPRAVGGVEAGPFDELTGDFVPAQDGCALPPLGDVRLRVTPGHAVDSAEALDLVELGRPLLAAKGGRWRAAELRRALDEERFHEAHPWGRVEDRPHRHRREAASVRLRSSASTETARTVRRPLSHRASRRPLRVPP